MKDNTLQIIVKMKSHEEHMKSTMNITIFSKGVPQYNHSLFITFTVSKITVMFVNFSLSDFLFLYNVMVYCASRDCLFEHFCVSCIFVVCLHLCSFCVFCVEFISCWLCCANHLKRTGNMKSHISCKNNELHSWCPKHDSKTLVRNRYSTNTRITYKKYCEFCFEKHKICIEKSSKFTISTKSTMLSYKCQN